MKEKTKATTWKGKIFEFFTGVNLNAMREYYGYVNSVVPSSSGLEDSYMFDFKNWQSQYSANGGGTFLTIGNVTSIDGNSGDSAEVTSPLAKIKVKPIDVLNELETMPTPFSLTLVDDKIQILKEKTALITQSYAKREIEALIDRLENRKTYLKHKDFFEKFENTTDEKIDKLLNKYDLVMKTSDIFVPEFPDEAILVMKDYSIELDKVCGKKPVFYVIAEPDKFRKAYDKRDPILLVQSPFGFYWQILGAWDKEMLLLSEL